MTEIRYSEQLCKAKKNLFKLSVENLETSSVVLSPKGIIEREGQG